MRASDAEGEVEPNTRHPLNDLYTGTTESTATARQGTAGPGGPTVDTGHYDDGHSLGWDKAPSDGESEIPLTGDTGHYDDGHSFGWDKAPSVGKSEGHSVGSNKRVIVGGIAAVALVAVVITVVASGGSSSKTTATSHA